MKALRALLVLAVVAALLVVAGLVADRVVGAGIERAATELVELRLQEVTDDDAAFTGVEVDLEGSALRGLAAGRFEAVTVRARGGVVDSVPVDELFVRAVGVVPDGSAVASVDMTVTADAAAAIASQLAPEAAEAVRSSAVAVPPDRLALQVPVALADGVSVVADVTVLARVADGTLVVEPDRAQVAGQDVDLSQVSVLRSFGLNDELRNGLEVTGVEVRDDAGTALVEVRLGCEQACSLR